MSILGKLAGAGLTMGLVVAIGAGAVPLAAAALPAKTPDACSIVTNTELDPAVGNPLDAGRKSPSGPGSSACNFSAADASGIDVGILVTTAAKGAAKQEFSVRVLESTTRKKSQKVSGLGARANFVFVGGVIPRGSLQVVDGKKGVGVFLSGEELTKVTTLEKAKAVAEVVLAKL